MTPWNVRELSLQGNGIFWPESYPEILLCLTRSWNAQCSEFKGGGRNNTFVFSQERSQESPQALSLIFSYSQNCLSGKQGFWEDHLDIWAPHSGKIRRIWVIFLAELKIAAVNSFWKAYSFEYSLSLVKGAKFIILGGNHEKVSWFIRALFCLFLDLFKIKSQSETRGMWTRLNPNQESDVPDLPWTKNHWVLTVLIQTRMHKYKSNILLCSSQLSRKTRQNIKKVCSVLLQQLPKYPVIIR